MAFKFKTALPILLLALPMTTFASDKSIISSLQNTQLTAYEAGKFRLESLAVIAEIAGEKKRNSPKFTVLEKNGLLGVEVKGPEKASKMTDSYCQAKLQELNKIFDISKAPRILWPNLNADQSSKIMNELFITLTMEAKENSSFTLSCTKTLANLVTN